MADIKLDVVADILLKGGKVDTGELDKLIKLHLKSQAFPDILLDPKVKIGKNTVESARAQLDKLATELKHLSMNAGEAVSGATKKAYKNYSQEQQAALSGLFRQLHTTLGTAGQSEKFSAPFIKKMDAIRKGIGSVFNLDDNEKRLAKEYINHISQTQGQLQSVLSKARNINKKFHTGDAGGTATPLVLSGLGAKVSESASYISKLKSNLNEEALIAKAQGEAAAESVRMAKNKAAALADTARVRAQENAMFKNDIAEKTGIAKDENKLWAAQRSAEEKAAITTARVERKRQEAAERQEKTARAEAVRYRRAGLGERHLASIGGIDGNLAKIPRSGLNETANAIKGRINELDKSLNVLSSNNAFPAQKKKIAEAEAQLQRLRDRLKEVQTLLNTKPKAVPRPGDKNFVGPVYDQTKEDALARIRYGNELLAQAGGRGGARNVSREHLPLVREALEADRDRLIGQRADVKSFDSKAARSEWSRLSGEIQKTEDALKRVTTAQSGFGSASQQTGALFRQFFRYALGYGALYQMLAAVRGLIKGIVDLDSALKNIQAVTGGTQTVMNGIAAAIKRTALATNFSVAEIAKAAQILAQAGVKPDQFASALSAVATFASATETSIATAADLVSTMRSVYSELDDLTISNQLTKAVNISKLTGEDLKTILSLGAQTAESYNISSEQFLAAVTVLRNAGIKASTVATGLRQGVLELLSPDSKTLKALEKRYKELGEDFSQNAIKGKFFSFGQAENPLVEALKEYRRLGFAGSAKKEFARVFDIRAQNAVLPLIKNIEALTAAETELTFGNAALKAARTQMEALAASVVNLGASITVLSSNLTGGAVEGLETLADAATDTVRKLTQLDSTLKASTGTGILTSIGGGLAGGTLAAVGDRGNIGSKVLKFAAGASIATTAGLAGSKGAEEAGGGTGAATVASTVLSLLSVLAFIPSVRGKLKGVVGKLPLVSAAVTSIASLFTGFGLLVTKLGGLLGAVTPLGRIITGGLTLAGVAATAYSYLTEDKVATAKAKLDQSLKNDEAAKAARQATLDEQETFRLSSSGRAAGEGTTAASVEKLKLAAADYEAQVALVVGTGADELEKVTAALLQLNKYGYESDSPASQLLIDEVQKLTDKKLAVDADSRKQLLALADTAVLITQQSKSLRSSIAADAALLLEAKEARSPVEQAFLDTYNEQLASDNRDALLGTAKVLPGKMAEIAEAMLESLKSKVEQSEAVKKQIKDQAIADEQKIDNAISLLRLSESPEDLANQVTRLIGSADGLGAETLTFVGKLRDGLQTAIADLKEEGLVAKVGRFLGFDGKPDLDELLKKQAEHRNRKRLGRAPGPGDAPRRTPFDSQIEKLQATANLEEGDKLVSAFQDVLQLGQSKTNEEKRVDTGLERKVLQEYLNSNAFKKVQPGLADSTKAVVERFESGKEEDLVPDIGKNGVPTGYLTEGDSFSLVKQLVDTMTLSAREEAEARGPYVESTEDFGRKLELDNVIAALKAEKSEKLTRNDSSNPILQKRDLDLRTKAEEIDDITERLASTGGKEAEGLDKNLLKARNDLIKIAVEADGDIQDAARARADENERLATKDKATAEKHRNREKALKNDSIKALERNIELALESGDLEAVQRLDAERIELMKLRNQHEIDSLVAAGEEATLIADTKKQHEEELRIAIEQNRSSERIIGALDKKYERLNAEATFNNTDPYREASGVEYRDSQKLKQFSDADANAANQIAELQAELDKELNSGPVPQDGQARLLDYRNKINDLMSEGERRQYEQDKITKSPGAQLDQGFNLDAITAGVENLGGSMKNLGENIQGTVVQGIDDMAGSFSNALVNGESLFDGLRSAAAAALRDIAAMIIKSGILKLGAMALGGLGFSGGGVVEAKATGGVVKAAKGYVGGVIKGRGTGTSDSISGVVVDGRGRVTKGIRVSNKEAIVTAKAVSELGEGFINKMNADPKAVANMLRAAYSAPMNMASGGAISRSARQATSSMKPQFSAVEYNHNTQVSVEGGGGNAPSTENLSALSRMIDAKVKGIIQEQKRPGGILNNRY